MTRLIALALLLLGTACAEGPTGVEASSPDDPVHAVAPRSVLHDRGVPDLQGSDLDPGIVVPGRPDPDAGIDRDVRVLGNTASGDLIVDIDGDETLWTGAEWQAWVSRVDGWSEDDALVAVLADGSVVELPR